MNKGLRLITMTLAIVWYVSMDWMLPHVCSGSYLIKLKTGVDFVTDQYWEENGQLKFNHYGGMMGVPKDMVASVTKSEAAVPEEIVRTEAMADATETGTENKEVSEEKSLPYQNDLIQNQNNIDREVEKFNTAKKKKDQASKDAAWKALAVLKKEQNQLREKVMALYNGNLPKWWGEITGESD